MNRNVPPKDAPYVIAVYLRALFEYVRAQGKAVDAILEASGLTEDDLTDSDRLIEDIAEDRAFVAAEKVCKDPNIGLHVGCSMRPTHLGTLGHLLLTTTHLGEVMDLHLRYAQLVGNGISARYGMDGDLMCLEVHVHPARPPYHRHTNELNVAGWITMVRWLSGVGLAPARIEFPHAAPADLGEQRAVFRCPMTFNAPMLRLFFPPHLLRTPCMHGNAGLHGVLEQEARRRLQALRMDLSGQDELLQRLRAYLAEHLPHGVPELGAAATVLGFSPRNLQRQLDIRSTGYKEAVDALRQDLARRYAQDASLSLVDIALMLGFSEQSTFQRAFRRWFQVTPGEYRRNLQDTAGSARGASPPPRALRI